MSCPARDNALALSIGPALEGLGGAAPRLQELAHHRVERVL
jgi:hypothetical protein